MAASKKAAGGDSPAAQPLPGAVISPGVASDNPAPAAPAPEAPAPVEASAPAPELAADQNPAPHPQAPDLAADDSIDQTSPEPVGPAAPISWTASEFIAHEKSAGWYLGVVVASVLCGGLVYFITKDKVSMSVVLMAGFVLGFYGARKPKQIQYHLDNQGITVGSKHFVYNSFRSFSVIPEGAFSSIVFMPHKRFALPLTLYYAPDDEDNIVDILADQLPLEERRPDAVDSLMRRIRF